MNDPKLVLLGQVLAGFAVVITALLGYIAANSKNRNERRRDTIADRDGLISGLQTEMQNLKADFQLLRSEVAEVRGQNNALIAYIHKLLSVLRRHNLEEHIPPDAPTGINL